MTHNSNILAKVEEYIVSILTKNLSANIIYHSIDHTRDVVASVVEIGGQQNLAEVDLEIVQIAAWFHDVGYSNGCENHEQNGIEMAQDFLLIQNFPELSIEKVAGCILATRMPQDPKNDLEKIICDADMLHLASDNYFKKAKLLHDEIEKTKACKISDREWLKMNFDFLKNHAFFTKYAKEQYTTLVKKNLKKINEQLMLSK